MHWKRLAPVFDQVAGCGPLQQYFDDRAVEETWTGVSNPTRGPPIRARPPAG